MNNKKIIYLSLGLLLIVATLVVSISAWLTDQKATPSTTFTVGKVEYTINGAFTAKNPVAPFVPGEQLIATAFTFTNSSTVDSELRVKIYLDVVSSVGAQTITYNNATAAEMGTYFTTGTTGVGTGAGFSPVGNWVFNSGYWYYNDSNNTTITPDMTTPLSFLNTLRFDGSKVGNSFSTDTFELVITIQAKQKDHVEWSDLTSIDFSTGL